MIDPKLRLRDALTSASGPDVYTDEAPERAALTGAAAMFVRTGRRVWRVAGADAIDYLHRMLTQDIKRLAPSAVTRACLLSRNGRVLGDFLVWRDGATCVLDAEPQAAEHAMPVLEKFVIADDVTFDDISDAHVRFALVGPEASAVLAASGIDVPALGSTTIAALADPTKGRTEALATLAVAAVPHGAGVRFECLARREHAATLVEAWIADERTVPVGSAAFDAERIRVVEPTQPNELNGDMLFNEAQLESAVSWNKGCYPGQEPVVMAKHRGHPPRLLVGLAGPGAIPPVGASLSRDGRDVGLLTSAVSADGGWLGLGLVKHAVAEAGGKLSSDHGPAEIRSV